MAGALCTANFDPEVIPAKGKTGKNQAKSAEEESAQYTCSILNGDQIGLDQDAGLILNSKTNVKKGFTTLVEKARFLLWIWSFIFQ